MGCWRKVGWRKEKGLFFRIRPTPKAPAKSSSRSSPFTRKRKPQNNPISCRDLRQGSLPEKNIFNQRSQNRTSPIREGSTCYGLRRGSLHGRWTNTDNRTIIIRYRRFTSTGNRSLRLFLSFIRPTTPSSVGFAFSISISLEQKIYHLYEHFFIQIKYYKYMPSLISLKENAMSV